MKIVTRRTMWVGSLVCNRAARAEPLVLERDLETAFPSVGLEAHSY
jgi:hypothetical protein